MRNKIRKVVTAFLIIAFISSGNLSLSFSQNLASAHTGLNLVLQSQPFTPPVLRGIRVDSSNPFKFDFILDKGALNYDAAAMHEEAQKIIKYFLASLTISEEDLWVNLSPYEKDRIVPGEFGNTTMGREMLSQDYLLKQLAASLTYPETELGKAYWDEINNVRVGAGSKPARTTERPPTPSHAYRQAGLAKRGSEQSFNKVWIVPDKAVVYEDGLHAFIATARFKVMTEEDYLAMQNNGVGVDPRVDPKQDNGRTHGSAPTNAVNAFKQHILPIIEKEVNEGKNFAPLRQIYYSLILSVWFKKQLKETAIAAAYFNKKKIKGVDSGDEKAVMRIYDQYLNAFKQGAYNYVEREFVGATNHSPVHKITRRAYFSGGVSCAGVRGSVQYSLFPEVAPVVVNTGRLALVEGNAGDINAATQKEITAIETRITYLRGVLQTLEQSPSAVEAESPFLEAELRHFHYNGDPKAYLQRDPLTAVKQLIALCEIEQQSKQYPPEVSDHMMKVVTNMRYRGFIHELRHAFQDQLTLGMVQKLLDMYNVPKATRVPFDRLCQQYNALYARFDVVNVIYEDSIFALSQRNDAILLYAMLVDLAEYIQEVIAIKGLIIEWLSAFISRGYDQDARLIKAYERIEANRGVAEQRLGYVQQLVRNAGDSLAEDKIDVNFLVTVALAGKRRQFDKQISIELPSELDSSAPKAWGTVTDINLLITNLLDNACDAAIEKAEKEAERAASGGNANNFRGRVVVATRQEGDDVLLEVRDNGMGIPKDKIASGWIYVMGHTTKPPNKGTGWGLRIVSDLVQRMGGEIEVRSTTYEEDPEHSGTIFTIRLPKEKRGNGVRAPEAGHAPEGGVRLKTDNITFVNTGNGVLSRLPVKANVQVEGLVYNIERIKNISNVEEFSRLMH